MPKPKKTTKKSHVKPTKEELKEKQKVALEASPSEPEPSEPIPSEPIPSEPLPSEPEPSKEPEAEPSKEMYKRKYSASSRENQKIYAKNRVINKALAEAEDVPEPTEDELSKEFNDWDIMSDTEKAFAKETIISRRWRDTISQAKQQAEKIEKWNNSVDEFTENPQTLVDNPDLEGKTDEFKEFAKEELNNNVPFNILIGAFLHQQSVEKKTNKGSMFERGGGGSSERPKPKSDKISLEEAKKLRETNYNKYKEYLIAGKIDRNI